MMDASSTVATASAGGIFVTFWVAASVYLFVNKNDGITKDESHVYSWTFRVESFRFCAFLNFVIVLGIGYMITEKSGLDTIQDPTETVVFRLFGFNHTCNVIDHNPARMIAAILLLPLVQIPFMIYTVLWHCRLAGDVKIGLIPKWLLNLSRVLTPFNFFTAAELHLWLVNKPDDTYGFTAHYIPYLMFQISICLIQLMNICYLTLKNQLPWKTPSWLAWIYFSFFTVLTVFSIVIVISMLAGDPIISAFRSDTEESITNILSYCWAFFAVIGTLILSYEESRNGDAMTLTFGDSMLSLETEPNPDSNLTLKPPVIDEEKAREDDSVEQAGEDDSDFVT